MSFHTDVLLNCTSIGLFEKLCIFLMDNTSAFLKVLVICIYVIVVSWQLTVLTSFLKNKWFGWVFRFYKLKMEDQTAFCHILLFYFHKGKNAHQACEKLHKVYTDNDGSWNSMLVILISMMLLSQGGQPRLMMTK